MYRFLVTLSFVGFSLTTIGQERSAFKQLREELPTPNTYRASSGAPGHQYWQQRVDYKIDAILDENKKTISGSEMITYFNNSPDVLSYLWVQLDQNIYEENSITNRMKTQTVTEKMEIEALHKMTQKSWVGGYEIKAVKDKSGKKMPFIINGTMMRIDLPEKLLAGKTVSFGIDWNYPINNTKNVGGRSGYEHFDKDGNDIFEIAQWFPRCAVYSDYTGWQHKQFLGRGEFTLPFGNYEVNLTVPNDHVVSATGELQNASAMLTKEQQSRYERATKAVKPVIIVTQAEAEKAEKEKATGTKTWVYKADNVRDFAFASSRKFIWDAMSVNIGGKRIMAMSYYPKEGNPLWEKYSTESVAHTLEIYSKHTIDYPYPVAISVNGPIGGMEYPMICFNGPRPQEDGTYSERTKYGLISVIIHEVGHNFFPMIINSDERQWSWMDEGLNTFVQYLAEKAWDKDYPSSRGPARKIADYMRGEQAGLEPIMTNSESIKQFGNNAYGKPATGLNILRETIMGRELFDYAFKEYAKRWAFKHPEPADFFRTMEDASAVDLDWFWWGWFFTTKPVDLAIEKVTAFQMSTSDPDIDFAKDKAARDAQTKDVGVERNKTSVSRIEKRAELKDFYNSYDPLNATPASKKKYKALTESLNAEQKALLTNKKYYYQVDLANMGGFVMPLILEMTFEDGTQEIQRYPVESWLSNEKKCSKVVITDKPVKSIVLDPAQETADIDMANNYWPAKNEVSRFQLFKNQERERNQEKNPMQQQRDSEK